MPTRTLLAVPLLTVLLPALLAAQEDALLIDPGLHHLGDSVVETWTEVPAEPEGTRLDLTFGSRPNAGEWVLEVRHRDVDNPWSIELNGQTIAQLKVGKEDEVHRYRVPAGVVRSGDNRLSFVPSKTTDDIVIGAVRLHRQSLRTLLKLQRIEVRVAGTSGTPLPARVTLADASGRRAEHYEPGRLLTAVRDGICYTADGMAAFQVPPGRYTVYAGRGMEWSMATAEVEVPDVPAGDAEIATVELVLQRDVDTSGWIAADTHIHTLTHSGHGDSSVEERMVTLAAEGVELAIATDHNHNTDYAPTQREMGLTEWFTPVTGNEVTTKVGHMNAFPLRPGEPVPNHRLMDWVQLIADIKSHGAKVVILNHPRWPQIPTGPFGEFGLSRLTGDLPGQTGVPFDAMELVNSTTLQRDPLFLFTDWFALLNHGVPMTAAGTSDSHTVGDPVGQGRTYVPSRTDDPASIDVDRACKAFQDGRTTVSMGIFAELTIDGEHGVGDRVRVAERKVHAALRVAAARWVRPNEAIAFVNGREVMRLPVPTVAEKPTDVTLDFTIGLPEHDAHLVFAVLGDGIQNPHWPTEFGYTIAATNPVWLDVDRDGRYTSPRASGEAIAKRAGNDPAKLRAAIANVDDVDDAVAVQALHAARLAWEKGSHVPAVLARVRTKLAQVVGEPASRKVLAEYLAALPELGDDR